MTITINIKPEHLGSLALHLAREHFRARRIRALSGSAEYLRQVAGDIRDLVRHIGVSAVEMRRLFRAAFAAVRGEGGAR